MSLTLIEKINLLQGVRREEQLFSDLEKYVAPAETLLQKAIISLKQDIDKFNPAAYMMAYSLLTIFLPLAISSKNNNTFWDSYRSEVGTMVYLSTKFKNEISELGPRFLFDNSMTKDYLLDRNDDTFWKGHGKDSGDKKKKEGTRAFEAIKERIANITFSDSPTDIKERPKFYSRFKLSENGLPEGRFKEAIVKRTKTELYQFKTTNSDESYITSYCLIYVVMPMLGHIDNSLVEDWLKIKQRHGRK